MKKAYTRVVEALCFVRSTVGYEARQAEAVWLSLGAAGQASDIVFAKLELPRFLFFLVKS